MTNNQDPQNQQFGNGQNFDPNQPQNAQNPQNVQQPVNGENAYAQGSHPVGEEKKSGAGSWIARIAVPIVIILALAGWRFHDEDWFPLNNNAQAGDCVSADVENTGEGKAPKAVDCGSDEAKYKILEKGKSNDLPTCLSVEGYTTELTYTKGSSVTRYCMGDA